MPDGRDVPPKISGGLYRAGVAELLRHIIRMVTMSTKTLRLFLLKVGIGVMDYLQVLHFEICMILLLLMRPSLLLLDLFIYLNFEQKQHSIHHRQFVDIYNLHGINIAPIVLFITLYPMMMGIVLLGILTKNKPLKGTCVYSGAREIQITLLRYAIILLDNNFLS